MDNNTFFTIEYQNSENGATFAAAEKVPNCYNLLHHFTAPKGFIILSINACDTWKKAQEIAGAWNEAARAKNNYAF